MSYTALYPQLDAANIANVLTAHLLGRYSSGTGLCEQIALGAHLSLTAGVLDATGFGSGSVTSVALTVPSWLAVGGSPVTSSGTLAVTVATGQTTNRVLATPDGATGAVALRALVPADMPALGTAATQNSTAFDAAGLAAAALVTAEAYTDTVAATKQPLDATLTAFAALTIAANSLTVGSGADAFSQTTFAANTFPARASSGNLVAKTITDFGLSLVDDADASTARATLGLGTLATQSGTFSGTSSGTNTGDQSTVSGNAGTATALATARTIGGVSFDGTANIVPQTIESANEATDTTCFLLFVTASGTQQLQPKNNTGLTFNAATGSLATTTFVGALTGNAATVTTNANLTGPITSVGNATSIASQTGTGTKFVMDTGATLVTPALGVATATSLNKVTITSPATGSTLTLADGKTLTASNTLTFTGTDSSSVACGAGGTVAYLGTAQTFTALQTLTAGITTSGADFTVADAGTTDSTAVRCFSNGGNFYFQCGSGNNFYWRSKTTAVLATLQNGGNLGLGVTPSYRLDVSASAAGGSFVAQVVNTGATTGSNGIILNAGSSSAGGAVLLYFLRPDGTSVGNISQATATTVAYNTSSDARLKRNVRDTGFSLADLLRVKVRDFAFVADPEQTAMTGFVAQELAAVCPMAVTRGGDDATKQPWGIDYGKLTPFLVAALQDAARQIKDLQTQLMTLSVRTLALEGHNPH